MYLTRTAGIETQERRIDNGSASECILPALRELKHLIVIQERCAVSKCILPALRELKRGSRVVNYR